jgi:uncharacterized protein
LPPRPDPKFFTLSSEADVAALRGEASGPIASQDAARLGLGPIKFPKYLDRLEVVTRIDNNRVAVSGADRWAEPLDSSFEKVLVQDLSVQLPKSQITTYPWYGDRLPDFQVLVDVRRFDASTEGLAQLEASWTIIDLRNQTALYSTTSAISQSAGRVNEAGAVAALSRAITDFSDQIAARVREFNVPRSRDDKRYRRPAASTIPRAREAWRSVTGENEP